MTLDGDEYTMTTSTMLKTIVTTKFKWASAAISAAIILATYVTSSALPETYVTSAAILEPYVAPSATLPETYAATYPTAYPTTYPTAYRTTFPATYAATYPATYPTTYPTTYPDSSLATEAFSTVPGGQAVRRAHRCPHRLD